ncbi:hypothetical protein BDY21DRAFT_276924 [Lineolata rhizophorae]|uniref:CsbD-like domain-containing protein n=1 Tax=Lineolata rhizophorae TaxID=578093 RepID=A0A6A6PDU4_9PEZI|nr:hypothetical protein BDY21DRAFT_276924 [Lineolata rhizophorae]
MSDKNTQPSTLQSVVDSAGAAAQSVVGSVTGNKADQTQAQDRQAKAETESDLSHTTAKAGPMTATPDGVAVDSEERRQGSWNQTIGSGKEMLGNVVGSENLRQQGIRQNQEGKEQEARGQLSDYGSGIKDRVGGAVGGAAAALQGDREEQERRMAQHDVGKTQQRGVEADLQKQVEAEQK